jgi:ABC-type glycerol-3-phosphate transport system substrate-binding protein
MEDVPDTRVIEPLLPEFTAATGIKVEMEIVQYLDMHQKLVANFMSPTGNYDVVEVDNYWAGEFPATEWIIPLDDYIKKDNFDTSVYIPALMDLVGYYPMTGTEKKVYMIPMWTYCMGLIYRTDIMDDPALQSAYKDIYNTDLKLPESLEEYVQLCKFMQENAGVVGSSMQGGRGDSIVMEWSNYLYSVGGTYYDENWNATINDANGLKAIELYKDNINNAAPEGALAFNFDDALRVFMQGEAFSMASHTIILPMLEDPANSKVVGKYALVPMPGKNSFTGAWGWSIAANSQYKDEAWEFIKWVETFDIAKKRALGGGFATRTDVFNDPEVIAKNTFYPLLQKIIAQSKAVPEFLYSTEMIEIVGRELSLICSGEKSPQEGLDLAAEQLDELAVKAKLK